MFHSPRSHIRSLLLIMLCLAASSTNAPAQVGIGEGGGARRCNVPRPSKSETDDKIYTDKEVTCRAVVKSRPEPAYPKKARDKRVQGSLLLRVVLLASGKVGEVTVVRGLPEGVSEAAVEAARRINFTPAIKDDRWVSQRVLVEYAFYIY